MPRAGQAGLFQGPLPWLATPSGLGQHTVAVSLLAAGAGGRGNDLCLEASFYTIQWKIGLASIQENS